MFSPHKRTWPAVFFLVFVLLCIPLFSFATNYSATTLDTGGDIAVMEFIGDINASAVDGSYASPLQTISNEFYATHADNYDFLIVFSGFDFEMPATDRAAGFHLSVRNDVRGIGEELFDYAASYGSDSKLQGVIVGGYLGDNITDPLDPEFTKTMTVLSHEILHQWAARVSFQDLDGSDSQALLGMDNAHWSFLLDTDGSLMYGNEWQDNGDGTFTSLPGRKYYSPLDLYLMGFIDKAQVPPMSLIVNPDVASARLPITGETVEGTVRTITIDDIIAAEGERIPSVANAQKRFRVGTIIIVRPGEYDEAQVVQARMVMSNWSMWFSALTDGKGAVVPDATPTPVVPHNPGIDDPVYAPREAPPEIADGVAWLMDSQNEDGSWQDSDLTAPRDTYLAVLALANFSTTQTNCSAGLQWLAGILPVNSDYLAKKTETLIRSGNPHADSLAKLMARQNSDGGWGLDEKKYGSNPLDTACVLRSLLLADSPDSAKTSSAIDYLIASQRADGSWGCDEYQDDVRTTSYALGALAACEDISSLSVPIQNGLTWLYGKQNLDGGFGNSPSTVYDTALALLAMQQLNADAGVKTDALNYILGLQAGNGSWYNSPYQTALAVSAIWESMHEPDLVVATGDISFAPSSVTSLPETITVQANIRNEGLTDVSQTTVALYEGGIAEAAKISEQTIALAGSSSTTVAFETNVTEGRAHRFYVEIDSQNKVSESCETNNTALNLLYPESTYDFEIQDADIVVTPDVAEVLTQVVITTHIRNKGAADAFNVPLSYFVDGAEIAADTITTLTAGGTVIKNFIWEADRSGTLSLSVMVDPKNTRPDELSEDNNVGVASLTINPLSQPNLSMAHTDIDILPMPLLEGRDADITALVENNGFDQIDNIAVTFYNGVPEQGGTIIGTATTPSLTAGESQRVGVTWSAIPVAGEHIIYVETASSDAVAEIKETDNNAFVTVDILSLPDLAVSAGAITVNPSISKEGDIIEITVMVQNTGEQDAADVVVQLLEAGNEVDAASAVTIPGLSRQTVTFSYDTTGTMGAHEIEVVVDPGNNILEQDETNNIATRSFGVQDADLWLTERYISPNGDGVQDATQFFFNLSSPQTVYISIADEKGEEVRRFSGDFFNNTNGGNIIWDGINEKEQVVDDGDYDIQIRSTNDSLLASLSVVVDNNRSSLMDAIGTNYLYNKNLTCMLPYINPDNWQWFSDESGILFYIPETYANTREYPRGLYTMTPEGENITRLVPSIWREAEFDGEIGFSYYDYVLSPDESQVAFILDKSQDGDYLESQLWTVGRYGEGLTNAISYDYEQEDAGALVHRSIKDVQYASGNKYLAYVLAVNHETEGYHEELHMIRPDGTDHQKMAEVATGMSIPFCAWALDGATLVYVCHDDAYNTPDTLKRVRINEATESVLEVDGEIVALHWLNNGKLVVSEQSETWVDYSYPFNFWLVDVADSDATIQVAADIKDTYYWSPDFDAIEFYPEIFLNPAKDRFAFVDNSNGNWSVRLCDVAGNIRTIYEAPFTSDGFSYWTYASLNDLRWSPDGQSLAFMDYAYQPVDLPDEWGDVCYYKTYLVTVDADTGRKTGAFPLDIRNGCEQAFSYHIYAGCDDTWAEAGVLHYCSTWPEEQRLGISAAVDATSDPLVLRIVQQGMDEAFIESVGLLVDGTYYPPTGAVNVTTGQGILPDILSGDGVDAYGMTIDFTWDNLPAACDNMTLVMNANEWAYFYKNGSLQWLGNDAVLGMAEGPIMLAVDLDNSVKSKLPSQVQSYFFRASPFGNAVAYEQPVDSDSVCADSGYKDTWVMQSLLNLTASLTATRRDSAITLAGTAMDLHFDHYTLEYAAVDSPDDWDLIVPPVETPIVDDTMAIWIPPAAGAYYVRLTVSDKAGNTAVRRTRIFWGEKSILTGLYKTGVSFTDNGNDFTGSGDLFSPATSSSKNAVALHYKVLAPVHLEFTVSNEDGIPVRTIAKDYATLPADGTEDVIIWDGTDETGEIVPDGAYTMAVFDYEFYTEVDRTPPEVSIDLSDLAWRLNKESDPLTPCLYANLDWRAADKNLTRWTVEYGEGENPEYWVVHASGGKINADDQIEFIESDIVEFIESDIEFSVGKRFRLTAEDGAGNVSTVVTDRFLEEQVVLNRFVSQDDRHYLDLIREDDGFGVDGYLNEILLESEITLKPLETLRLPLTDMTIQYCGGDGIWRDGNSLEDPGSGILTIQWDKTGVDIATVCELRIKVTDETGAVHFSNELPFRPLLGIFTPECPHVKYLYSQGIREDLEQLAFQISAAGAQQTWITYHLYDRAAGDVIANGDALDLPLPEDHDPNTAYELRLVGTGVSGTVYPSETEPFPVYCDDGSEFRSKVYYLSSLECGAVNSEAVIVPVYKPEGEEKKCYPPPVFKSLTYTINNNDGLETTIVECTDASKTRFPISTSDYEEGVYEITGVLEYGDQRKTAVFNFYVDRQQPEAAITVPTDNARICPQYDEINRQFVDIEAILADNHPGGFAPEGAESWNYRVYYGRGENPTWIPALQIKRINGINKTTAFVEDGLTTGHLGQWDVTDLSAGTYSLKLLAVDHTGNVACDTISNLYLDNGISLSVSGNNMFSPNNDGVKDEMAIYYTLDEYARVSVTVAQEDTVVAELVQEQTHSPGSYTVIWYGDGAAEGTYTVTVNATDGCGNTNTKTISTVVDNTAPEAIISSPQAGDIAAVMVEIVGSADDAHFSDYYLEAVSVSGPDDTVVLAEGKTPVDNSVLAGWNTLALSGDWTLRLVVKDQAGNISEISVPVTLVDRQSLIKSLSASPGMFSPNNDDSLDQTDIQCELNPDISDTYDVTIQITPSAGGETVKTFTASDLAGGSHLFTWDGADEQASSAVAVDGEYAVTLTAALHNSPTTIHQETVTLVIDTAMPAVTLSCPAGGAFYQKTVSLAGSIQDNHLTAWQLECTDASAAVVFFKDGAQNCLHQQFALLDDLAEGDYTLTVTATDGAGNETHVVNTFVVDNTPPLPLLLSPEANSLFGATDPVAAITGTIEETHLASWTLRYGSGEIPTDWQVLATGHTLPEDEHLWDWPVGTESGIADGVYTISLLVEDKAGWRRDNSRQIIVDNTPPTVGITSPPAGGYLTTSFILEGTAEDANFSHYIVELSNNACQDEAGWGVIQQADAPVDAGTLASLSHLPSDGPYCIRLTANDLAGNTAGETIEVIVDTQPPPVPVLSVDPDTQTAVNLSWTPVTVDDLAGYNLYRNGQQIVSLITETVYADTGLDEGEYAYTVVAVDDAGWESDHSNACVVTVDLTGPSVNLTVPWDGAVINDLVEIKGTAYSKDDFKAYRVYLGVGQSPSEWTLLRTSPLSVPYGVLAEVAEPLGSAGDYAVKLEAEDINGNVSDCQASFVIDDVPPVAPVLLTAFANGASVDLTWEANSEPDLAGYLVYRNGDLVNADGPIVGSLAPYLIGATSYTDADLVDGAHTYFLVAMDQAGNTSLSSNEITVQIDTRAPQAVITSPADGLSFERPLIITAVCEDRDIDTVQFHYRLSGSTDWIDLGQPFSSEPFATTLDPGILALDYGSYDLQAVATDVNGNTDQDPAVVVVTYTDLTPPLPPEGLQAFVSGGDITFTWQANTEDDLAGYTVYYIAGNVLEPLNPDLLSVTNLLFADTPDGTYLFGVKAEDLFGNESDFSETVSVGVYTPAIAQPDTPVADPVVTISGAGAAPGSTVTIYVNGQPVADVSADAGGSFSGDLTLVSENNEITAQSAYGDDNLSNFSDPVTVIYSAAPETPINLAVSVTGYNCSLTWTPGNEADLAGYHIYRDGEKITADPVAEASYTDVGLADGVYNYAVSAVDVYGFESDLTTPAVATVGDVEPPQAPQGLTAQVVDSDVVLTWQENGEPDLAGYRVYRNDGGSWTPLNSVLLTTTTFTDVALLNGSYTYRVTALDKVGNESQPAEVTATVTAATPAAPAITLVLPNPDGEMIKVWWQSGDESSHAYNLYRGETPGGPYTLVNDAPLTDDLVYLDNGVTNGMDYYYRVAALDEIGNEGEYSTEVSARAGRTVSSVRPKIIEPTVSGQPITVDTWTTDIFGRAEAGTTIDLYRNGGRSGSVAATDEPFSQYFSFGDDDTEVDGVMPAPNATLAAYMYYSYTSREMNLGIKGLQSGDNITGTSINGDIEMFGWSPDSVRFAYFVYDDAAYAGRLMVYDHTTQTFAAIDEYSYDAEVWDTGWSPDGENFFCGIYDEETDLDQIMLYNTTTGVTKPITDVDEEAYYDSPLWSPDSTRLAYTKYTYATDFESMLVYDTTTEITERLTDDGNDVYREFYPSWSSDGESLVFGRQNHDDIITVWKKDFETGELSQILQDDPDNRIYTIAISPDSQYVACTLYTQNGYKLIVVAVETGNTVFETLDIGYFAEDMAPRWTRTSNRILYQGIDANDDYLFYAYDADADTCFQATGPLASYYASYDWHPDETRIVYMANDNSLGKIAVNVVPVGFPSCVTTLGYLDGAIYDAKLKFAENGGVLLIDYLQDDTVNLRHISSGTFTVDNAALEPGENIFQTRAVLENGADNGATSPWSDTITVTLDPTALPDLVLSADDFFIYPPTPVAGESVLGIVAVLNAGSVDADNVLVDIVAIDTAGQRRVLHSETITTLAAGARQSVEFFWNTAEQVGDYTITAIVDTDDDIYEADETNNSVEKAIRITEDYGLVLSTTLGVDQVVRGDSVPVYLNIVNSGPDLEGRLRLLVEDAYGDAVSTLADQEATVAYGFFDQHAYDFDTSDVIAGEYSMHAIFESTSGIISEDYVPFVILKDIRLTASVLAEQLRYGANATVEIGVRAQNNGASSLDTANVALRITNGAGIEVYSEDRTVSDILTGSSVSLGYDWNTGLHTPGVYTIAVAISADGSILAEAAGQFTIDADSIITGQVDVTPSFIIPGNTVAADYSLTNTGNSPATDVPVDIVLVDTSAGVVIDTTSVTVGLAAADTVSGSVKFLTDELLLKTYTVQLRLTTEAPVRVLAAGSFTVSDAAPPEVLIISPTAGSEQTSDFYLTVDAHDRLSPISRVEYAVDSGAWRPMPALDPSIGRYASRFVPDAAAEGAHVFSFRATDSQGNMSEPVSVTTTIVPKVDLSVILNAEEYGMDEDVLIAAELQNTAWGKQVSLTTVVEDDQGLPVHAFTATGVTLPRDGAETVNLVWNTGATAAGDYQVRARIIKDGLSLDEVIVPFIIRPVISLSVAAATDQAEYGMNEDVLTDISIVSAGNYEVAPGVTIFVLNSKDQVLHSESRNVAGLDHGDTAGLSFTWNTAAHPAGDYRIQVEAAVDEESASTSTAFAIRPVVDIIGAVTAPDSVPLSEPCQSSYAIVNNGNVPMTGLDIRLTMVDPDSSQTVLTYDTVVNVDISQTVAEVAALATDGLEIKSYQLKLFALNNNTHTLLAETVVAITDSIPPEITIISPTPDQIFDGPIALAVDAVDNATGIAEVQYRFDDGDWQPMSEAGADRYAAVHVITNEAEGSHMITFRAFDGAGNASPFQAVTIMIERNQAFNSLTGEVTASPEPVLEGTTASFNYVIINNETLSVEDLTVRVSLIDPDTGVSVKTLERLITLAAGDIFAANFTEIMDVAPKAYAVVLSVEVDGPLEPRELSSTTLEVIARPEIDGDKEISGSAVSLLVWLNDNCRLECGSHHAHGGDCGHSHGGQGNGHCQDNGEDHDNGNGCGHGQGQDQNHTGCDRCSNSLSGCEWKDCVRDDLVKAILNEAVLDYHIVTDKHDFELELRNPYYTDILVLGDHQNLGCKASAELMEKVNAGTGIVSSSWFQHTLELDTSPAITSIFGVRLDGAPFTHDYTLTTMASPISGEGTIVPSGTAQRVAAEGDAIIVGWLEEEPQEVRTPWGSWTIESGRSPAIVLDQYGKSRTVYFAFDLGLNLDTDNHDTMADLLANAIHYVHGSRNDIYPWQMVPVTTRIDTTNGDFEYVVTETFDEALRLYDPVSGTWVTDNPWEFSVGLDPDQTTALHFFYLVPDIPGTYTTEIEVGLIFDAAYVLLDKQPLDLVVTADCHTLYNDVIDTLNALNVSWWQKAIPWGMIKRLEKARNREINCQADIDKNISDIVGVIYSLFMLPGTETADIRSDLDTLLATEQGRYYFYESTTSTGHCPTRSGNPGK